MTGMEAKLFAGRYRTVRRLGAGGTATVFLARDERLEREVAVKRVHGAEVTAATAQRLQREARIMASLRHPNLVPVYDMVMDHADLLLIMEYVRGQTLEEVLARAPLDPERTLALLDPVATALDYVHDEGVVHRDLKPPNILVGADGVVKVADLGLATAAEITRITPAGAILGTPAYMAPEQAHPGVITRAADVYALATIAFQALSGTLPRWGPTVLAILAQATQEPPADLREHRPGTPDAVAEALMRAMSAAPEERQQSASQLLGELAAGFETRPARDRAVTLWPSVHAERTESQPGSGMIERASRRPKVFATGALAAVAVAAVCAWALLAQQLDSRQPSAPPPARAQATEPPGTDAPAATPSPAREQASDPPRTDAPAATPSPAREQASDPPGTDAPAATPSPAGAQPTGPPATAAPTATPSRARRPPLSATATVRAFYRRAAAGDYARAWSLAGPGMRRAFGNSRERFSRDLASLRRIEFTRVAVTARDDAGVTVGIETIATHDNRVDRCSGTLRTIPGDRGGWLVEPAGVRCTSS